jgi:cytoskeleton protein RodZ
MPEIGSTLREARMRARIDITEVEQATKIRAKYLRALENEEWNLLPGSTFIKSFLREYADYLGLDARTLVEEYKLRYDRPSEHELAPLSPRLGRDRRGGGVGGAGYGAPRVAPRWLIVGGALLLIFAALWIVGSIGGDEDRPSPSSTAAATDRSTGTTPAPSQRRTRTSAEPSAPAQAGVRIVPTGALYVCLVDGSGRVLIPGSQFEAGEQVPLYRAQKLRITLGNNAVQLRVNGRRLSVPASSTAIAYEITPSGARPLPLDEAPTCT